MSLYMLEIRRQNKIMFVVKGGLYLGIKEPKFFLLIIFYVLVFFLVQFWFGFRGGSNLSTHRAGRWQVRKGIGRGSAAIYRPSGANSLFP